MCRLQAGLRAGFIETEFSGTRRTLVRIWQSAWWALTNEDQNCHQKSYLKNSRDLSTISVLKASETTQSNLKGHYRNFSLLWFSETYVKGYLVGICGVAKLESALIVYAMLCVIFVIFVEPRDMIALAGILKYLKQNCIDFVGTLRTYLQFIFHTIITWQKSVIIAYIYFMSLF